MAKQKKFTLTVTFAEKTRRIELTESEYLIGKGAGVNLPLNDPRVSTVHARLEVQPKAVFLTDLGSTNGTFVDGEKLQAYKSVKITKELTFDIDPFKFHVEAQTEQSVVTEPIESVGSVSPDEHIPNGSNGSFPPGLPPFGDDLAEPFGDLLPPPGLDIYSDRLISYLPEIYQLEQRPEKRKNGSTGIEKVGTKTDPNDFLARFLGIFEAILFPVEWTIDHFDLFLHPSTAPKEFLPWLAGWFELSFDATWTESKKRMFIEEAHELFAMRGTKWSLQRVLEIYTGVEPTITDLSDEKNRFLFTVNLPIKRSALNIDVVQHLIDQHKPVHSTYEIKVRKG